MHRIRVRGSIWRGTFRISFLSFVGTNVRTVIFVVRMFRRFIIISRLFAFIHIFHAVRLQISNCHLQKTDYKTTHRVVYHQKIQKSTSFSCLKFKKKSFGFGLLPSFQWLKIQTVLKNLKFLKSYVRFRQLHVFQYGISQFFEGLVIWDLDFWEKFSFNHISDSSFGIPTPFFKIHK